MNILIIEDEHLSAKRLRKQIKSRLPEASFLEDIESVSEGLELFASKPRIDLIFSDIQLADGLSFEIFKSHQPKVPVIFTTAYDQYALEAFRSNGLDYLVKPIEAEELNSSLDKYERLYRPEDPSMMEKLNVLLSGNSRKYRERFMVKVGERIRSISAEEIVAFYSAQKENFFLSSDGRNYGLESSLDSLMEELDPGHFFKINRSYIVSFKYIDEIIAWSNSRLKLSVRGMEKHELIVARDRSASFKEWLGHS